MLELSPGQPLPFQETPGVWLKLASLPPPKEARLYYRSESEGSVPHGKKSLERHAGLLTSLDLTPFLSPEGSPYLRSLKEPRWPATAASSVGPKS